MMDNNAITQKSADEMMFPVYSLDSATVDTSELGAMLVKLQEELQAGLVEHDLTAVEDLDGEIATRITKLDAARAKGGEAAKAVIAKLEPIVEKLRHLQNIVQEISDLQKRIDEGNLPAKLAALQTELAEGLAEYDLTDVEELPGEIASRTLKLDMARTKKEKGDKGAQAIIDKLEPMVEKLDHLQNIAKEIAGLQKRIEEGNLPAKLTALETELAEGLAAHDIMDVEELSGEIATRMAKLAAARTKGGEAGKAVIAKLEPVVEKLKHLERMAKEIEDLRKKIDGQESQPTAEEHSEVPPPYPYAAKLAALEAELEAGLAEQDLTSVEELSEEITTRTVKLDAARVKGDRAGQAVIAKLEPVVAKLRHLQSIAQEINDLRKKADESNLPAKLAALEAELEEGLVEQGLASVEDLSEEIASKTVKLDAARAKGDRASQAVTAKLEPVVAKLRHLQSVVQEITDLRKKLDESNLPGKLAALEAELEAGLIEQGLTNMEDLPEELASKTVKLNAARAKGDRAAQAVIAKLEPIVAKLQHLQKIVKEIKDIKNPHLEEDLPLPELPLAVPMGNEDVESVLETFNLPMPPGAESSLVRLMCYVELKKKGINDIKGAPFQERMEQEFQELLNYLSQGGDELPEEIRVLNEKMRNLQWEDATKSLEKVLSNVQQLAKDKEYIQNITESLKLCLSMPTCSEKSLIRLTCHLELLIKKSRADVDPDFDIQKEFARLQNCLQLEQQDASELRYLFSQSESNARNSQWKDAIDNLSKMLEKLRPLDVPKMLQLIRETDKAVDLIKGRDVVLLLGGTGAGKSTTIHFLAGSEMRLTKLRGLNHIAPIKVKNEALRRVTTSPEAKSETRYITAVPINFADVGCRANQGSIFLCDTPGFEDTSGPEVDIANGIGIVRAVRKCSSVKPLVLISYMSMGARLTGLKQLAYILAGMMVNLDRQLPAFSYAFTNYPEDKKDQIFAQITNVLETMTPAERSHPAVMSFFLDMQRKATLEPGKKQADVRVIDPLHDQPGNFLDNLVGPGHAPAPTIRNPSEVFQFFITDRSRAVVQEQVRLHQLSIRTALKRFDYPFINYKLDELKSLNDVLVQDYIRQAYEDCIRDICQHFEEVYNREITIFNRTLEGRNTLTREDVTQYKIGMDRVKAAEVIFKNHLAGRMVSSAAFTQNVLKHVGRLSQAISDSYTVQTTNNNLLCGRLPGGTPVFFNEEQIVRDGNCGFITMGTDRHALAETLATLSTDPEARETLMIEIQEALTTETWAGPSGEWREVFLALQEKDAQLQRVLVEMCRKSSELANRSVESVIHWLNSNGFSDEAQTLKAANLAVGREREALETYCKREDVFLAYVDRLRVDTPEERLWLGYRSAILFAKAKRITFYIWTPTREARNQLMLTESYVPPVGASGSGQIIHGLHTDNSTHFNLLVEMNNPAEIQSLQLMNLDYTLVCTYLNKMRLLGEAFSEVDLHYKKACQLIERQLDKMVAIAIECIESHEFTKSAQAMLSLSGAVEKLKDHLEKTKLDERYNAAKQSLLNHLTQRIEKIDHLFRKVTLEEHDIEQLNVCATMLESTKDTFQSDELKKEIYEIHKAFLAKILNRFDSLNAKIKQLFEERRENALKAIGDLVKEMASMREISVIYSVTSDAYHQTMMVICGFIQHLQLDMEQSIDRLRKGESIDYTRFARCLSGLQNAKWIEKFYPTVHVHTEAMENIQQNILAHAEALQKELIDVNLPLEEARNIQEVYQKLLQVGAMKDLERVIDGLATYRENSYKQFELCIKNTLDLMRETFNLESRGLSQKRDVLRHLEEIKLQYDNLHPAKLFLNKNNYESIEVLDEEIAIKASELQRLEDEVAERLVGQIKILQALEKIDAEYNKNNEGFPRGSVMESPAAKSFLQENRYQNIKDLRKDKEKKQQNLEKDREQTTHELEERRVALKKLQEIKATFDAFKSEEMSPEGQAFLREHQYENSVALMRKIEQQRGDVEAHEARGVDYVFSKLDIEKTEKALYYLNVCKTVVNIASIKDYVTRTRSQLESYINQYVEFIKAEMTKCFENIQKAADDPQILLKRLQEILRLEADKASYPLIYPLFKVSEIIQEWQNTLSMYLPHLTREIIQFVTHEDRNSAQAKLVIAEYISRIERVLSLPGVVGEYATLNNKYQKILDGTITALPAAITQLIIEQNYPAIATALEMQGQLDDAGKAVVTKIKNPLSLAITRLMDATKTKAIMLGNTIELEKIEIIVENLNKINSAKDYVLPYVDAATSEKLSNFTDQVALRIVSEKMTTFLGSIKSSIKANNFSEAETKMDLFMAARNLLDRYCPEPIVHESDGIQTSLIEAVKSVVARYSEMSITEYSANPPKDIFYKFGLASERHAGYNEALTSLRDCIFRKFRDELQLARDTTHDREKRIRVCETALRSLPEDIKETLTSEVADCKTDIKTEGDAREATLQEAIARGDIEKIKSLLEEYVGKKDQSFTKIIREHVLRDVEKLKGIIEDKVRTDEVSAVFEELRKLAQYKTVLNELIPEIKPLYKAIQDRIGQSFEKLYRSLFEVSIEISRKGFDALKVKADIERRFRSLESLLECKKLCEDLLPSGFYNNVGQIYKTIAAYFLENQEKYTRSLQTLNISALTEVLKNMIKSEFFIKIIQRYADFCASNGHTVDPVIVKIVDKQQEVTSDSMKDAVQQGIKNLKTEVLKSPLINERTCIDVKERDEFYKQLHDKLSILSQAKELKDYITADLHTAADECISVLREKMRMISIEAEGQVKIEMIRENFDQFNVGYNHLESCKKFVDLLQTDANKLLEDLKQKVFNILENLHAAAVSEDEDLPHLVELLIKMQSMADNLPPFKKEIKARIENVLTTFKRKKSTDGIGRLYILLQRNEGSVAGNLLAEQPCFKAINTKAINDVTRTHGIEKILEKVRGDDLDKDRLRSRYEEFDREYVRLRTKYLEPEIKFDALIAEILLLAQQAGGISSSAGGMEWSERAKSIIPRLLASVFVLWTLQDENARSYFELASGTEDREGYLLRPHPAQVISIFRMLGLDDTRGAIRNNLVQIGTGEGKSVVLAVTSSVLALLGMEVSCACYSDYLQGRDYRAFQPMFDALGVLGNIQYGTFNTLCERIVNEQGDIRERVETLIFGNDKPVSVAAPRVSRPKILLIDEVDVFFNKDFYGNVYTPLVRLRHESIVNLINYIWQERDNHALSLPFIAATPQYRACATRFGKWAPLLDEAIKDMLADVRNFSSHDYIVHQDGIAYREQDGISHDVVYGYKTLFAYYHEHAEGNISEESLERAISIGIKCGSFSYAEIPLQFQCIMGVTGTLATLSDPEKHIIQNVYHITKNTYSPSMFGDNNLLPYSERTDLRIEKQDDYEMRIIAEINSRIVGTNPKTKRAVLVFFESKKELLEFYNSPRVSPMRAGMKVITEEVSAGDKEMLVKLAATSGQITLMTRSFGRGTDFVCRDKVVAANGGIHVIQTFFSVELSEEVQIKGRTARQGAPGSYSLVLLDKSLEKFLVTETEMQEHQARSMVYHLLNRKRNEFFKEQYGDNSKHVEAIKKEHELSQSFIASMGKTDKATEQAAQEFLLAQNKGATGKVRSRTICLMDATGSMSHLLQKAKHTVGNMFERAAQILVSKGLDPRSFEMQFAVYRNYDSREDKVLQYSPWETKPDALRTFMETIGVEGGLGNEAIEIGLWHANKENENGQVTQVILIGDAPPNTKAEVTANRAMFGEAYWCATKFGPPTDHKTQLQRFNPSSFFAAPAAAPKATPKKGVAVLPPRAPAAAGAAGAAGGPAVHTFFVAERARVAFKEIADATGGRCEALDINSPAGAEALTNLVTEEVLRSVGGASLVKAYQDTYVKSYAK